MARMVKASAMMSLRLLPARDHRVDFAAKALRGSCRLPTARPLMMDRYGRLNQGSQFVPDTTTKLFSAGLLQKIGTLSRSDQTAFSSWRQLYATAKGSSASDMTTSASQGIP